MRKVNLLLVILFKVAFAGAQIIHVPAAYPTIQAAIDASSEGDTVLVAEGTYYENIFFRGKAIMLASEFLLDGDTAHISRTIINGSQPSHPDTASVVTFDNCVTYSRRLKSVLNGFTITGGKGTRIKHNIYYFRLGGGVFIKIGSSGQVINNRITGNKLDTSGYLDDVFGAGIVVGRSTENVIISQNEICYNEAIYEGDLNVWAYGAGIYGTCDSGYLQISNNKIHHNIASSTITYKSLGAGLHIEKAYGHPGSVSIINNHVHHNELHCQSSFGGGLYLVYYRESASENLNTNVPAVISNNIFNDNYSQDKGGGIAIWNMCRAYGLAETVPDPILANNTLFNNRASDGAGIYHYDAETVMMNNILWDNLSASGCREIFNYDIYYPGGWNKNKNDGVIHAFYNDIKGGYTGEGNLLTDPKLTDDFCLRDGSPCIGAGTLSVTVKGQTFNAPEKDYFGLPRTSPSDPLVDIGAVEWFLVTSVIDRRLASTDLQLFPNPANGIATIRYSMATAGLVNISLYTLLGQKEMVLLNETRLPGTHEFSFDASVLKQGIYIVRMSSTQTASAKLVVK